MRDNKGRYLKGFHPNTQFKKGLVPWNKGLKLPQYSGVNHFAWKGSEVSYTGLHHWIKRQLGFPKKCELCGRNGLTGRFIQWANKSGKYLRDVTDWIRLCGKCHYKYDNKAEKRWPK